MKILVVRRDNIGDLVCTTPLFTALRQRFPEAWIGALVNSYNAPVLDGNPDLNEVIAYTKLKHLEQGRSAFGAVRDRLLSLWKLRRSQLDYVMLATSDFVPRTARLARWLAPKRVVGFSDATPRARRALDLCVPIAEITGRHEVERVFALAGLFGINGAPPGPTVIPDERETALALAKIGRRPPRIALHISARRPAQRWPAERFAELAIRLHREYEATVVLLWSPGPSSHARHPGDDEKAQQVRNLAGLDAGLIPYRTKELQQLIGALAACDAVICSDGGALHLAAALGKPIVALFGDSPAHRWRPWGVPHEVLQPGSGSVMDVQAEEVAKALHRLTRGVPA